MMEKQVVQGGHLRASDRRNLFEWLPISSDPFSNDHARILCFGLIAEGYDRILITELFNWGLAGHILAE